MPLQRRMTDFGADKSFSKACEKMKEHYGVIIPLSIIRNITEAHGAEMRDNERLERDIPDEGGVDCLIAEMNGSFIPLVDTFEKKDEEVRSLDKRETRELRWRDARLSLAHPQGSLSPVYGATLGDPDEAGTLCDCCRY